MPDRRALRAWWTLVKRAVAAWSDDYAPSFPEIAAGLSHAATGAMAGR